MSVFNSVINVPNPAPPLMKATFRKSRVCSEHPPAILQTGMAVVEQTAHIRHFIICAIVYLSGGDYLCVLTAKNL